MKEEYEIIFVPNEGRAVKNNKTNRIYYSEFQIIEEKDKEIERLNNIFNELEKSWKEEIIRFNNFIQEDTSLIEINNIRKMLIQAREKDLYKLQELKGSDK